MKKTLVAVAALAAIAGAHAEATIYGVFDQAYTTTRASDNTGVPTSSTNGLASPWTGNGVVLGVKAGEDLGDGLKLSGVVEFGFNINDTTSTSTPYTRQSFVALSGAFGHLRAGRQYSAAFNNQASVDPGGATLYGTLYQATVVDGTGLVESPLRQSNSIQYDLPNFVPGLNVGVNIVRAGTNSLTGFATGDGTGYNVNYSNGGLYVGYTSDTATDLSAALALISASTTDQRKLTTASASYDFGVAKIAYNNSAAAVGSEKLDTSMFAVSAPIGAATVYVSTSTGTLTLSGGSNSLKGTEYGVNYALSKRTTVYGRMGNFTTDNATVGSTKSTALGIQHTF